MICVVKNQAVLVRGLAVLSIEHSTKLSFQSWRLLVVFYAAVFNLFDAVLWSILVQNLGFATSQESDSKA